MIGMVMSRFSELTYAALLGALTMAPVRGAISPTEWCLNDLVNSRGPGRNQSLVNAPRKCHPVLMTLARRHKSNGAGA